MIESGKGTTEMHLRCEQGKHDFERCPDIMEHACFFCLEIQSMQSDYEEPLHQAPQAVAETEKGKKRKIEGAFVASMRTNYMGWL